MSIRCFGPVATMQGTYCPVDGTWEYDCNGCMEGAAQAERDEADRYYEAYVDRLGEEIFGH